MAVPVGQWSWAKGEVAPSLHGRVDLADYRVAAALLRNFTVDYRGGVTTRPGTQFMARARASEAVPGVAGQPRLIRFVFATVQAYWLEFGNYYMRVHYNPKGGQPGPVLEPGFAITAATRGSPATLTIPDHDFVVHDAICISGVGGMTALNGGTYLVAAVSGNAVTLNTLDGMAVSTIASPAYTSGGTAARLYTMATPYAAADLPLLKFTQSAQTMTICHPNYAPRNLTRAQHWDWTLSTITFAAQVYPPTGFSAQQTTPPVPSGQEPWPLNWYYAYVVTAVSDNPAEESTASGLVSLGAAGTGLIALDQSTGCTNIISWLPPATGNPPNRYNIYKANPTYGMPVPDGATFGLIGTTTGLTFVDTNIGPNFASTPPLHNNPFAPRAIVSAKVTASGSGYNTPVLSITDATGKGAVVRLSQSGGQLGAAQVIDGGADYTSPTCTVIETGGGGSGAVLSCPIGDEGELIGPVAIVKAGSGYGNPIVQIVDVTGYGAEIVATATGGIITSAVLVKAGTSYSGSTITVLDQTGGGSGGAVSLTVGPATGTWPSVVEYYQQRLCFAASLNNPETIWATQPANPTNMDVSQPTVDSDALQLTLFSRQVNAVQHLVSMPTGLIAFTSGGAWLIGGGSMGSSPGSLTPTNMNAQTQASNGAAPLLSPLTVNYDVIFLQARGSYPRDFNWNFYVNIYTGQDLGMLSNHLFNGHQLTDWCWSEEPDKLIWAVRDDGMLLALTYLKEQEVRAWTHHDTQGAFRSVAAIPDGQEDAVGCVVERYIGGRWLYLIERMHSRQLGGDATRDIPGDARLAWCVDSGLAYPLTYPAAALTPTGLTAIANTKGPPTWCGAGTFLASAPITVNVGDVLEINGGVGTVTAGCVAGTSFQATVNATQPMLSLLPSAAGVWSCTTPVTTVSGLDHLNGQSVVALADGGTVAAQTVVDGTIALPAPAARIVAGLSFTCQMQTLRIEAGDVTLQGRRKKIAALTARVVDTRGLAAGHNFQNLYDIKGPAAYQVPAPLVTGDLRLTLDPQWELEGQVCLQQNYPLPAQIVALIPEIEAGDTQQ